MPHAPREAQGRVQQKSRAEGMCVVDREQVGVGPSRTALARVSEILETVEAHRVVVLVRIFHADQVPLAETVVDLDVKLIVVALTGAGSKPVVVNALLRRVWFRIKLQH